VRTSLSGLEQRRDLLTPLSTTTHHTALEVCEAHFIESVEDLQSQIDKLELPNIITELIQSGFASEGGPALAPSRPDQPAPSAHSPKKGAQTSVKKGAQSTVKSSGKQYGCFLSHHKAACAMEGED
jgi:hypothetical protein